MKADALAPWQPERDQWGRPKIVAPDGTVMGYTRASTLAKTLDAENALANWGERMVGAGLALRPDLLALIQSHLAPNGDIPEEHRKAIQGWTDEAKEAAKSAKGANLGTALHKFTETLDAGEKLANVPAFLEADLQAYRDIMRGIEIVAIEQFVVIDSHRVAGTFDRILRFNGDLVIGDLKTTQNIEYSHNANAVQLAGYSRGTPYRDGVRGVPLVDQGVRQDYGVVIWLPSGAGHAELYTVDLTAGWEAFEMSVAVRKWRDRRVAEGIRSTDPAAKVAPTPTPFPDMLAVPAPLAAYVDQSVALLDQAAGPLSDVVRGPAPVTPVDPWDSFATQQQVRQDFVQVADTSGAVVDWLKHRILALPDAPKQTLAGIWPADLPTFKSGHPHSPDELERINQLLNGVEREYNVPFGAPDPRSPEPPASRYVYPKVTTDAISLSVPWRNEVADIANAAALRDALMADFNERPVETRDTCATWLLQARTAGCGFSLSECMSYRRVQILNACYALIEHLGDDELIHAAITQTSIDPLGAEEHGPVGARLGKLTKDQAHQLGELARSVGCGDATPIFNNDGRVTHYATKENTQ